MTQPVDLSLNLDSSNYVQGAQQAAAANAALEQSYAAVERHGSLMQKALSVATPGKIAVAAFGAATYAAANFQSEISGIRATAAVTGQSMTGLTHGVTALARAFPVGNKGAMEVVSTLQQMGYSGKNQIKTIDELGKSYIRLGAATGNNASMIGRQMTTLDRAFGAADANTDRFNKMSDSLVGVTSKIGGSATEILAFSKNIAPMARTAGIGQTAVMGISAAFSKMGEDGYAASNAMNRVLADLNHSVRDGSSEMGTYANIVGKTRGEFEQLFKLNPTKALSEVVNSLASGGSEGARNLERLGLDGVRTQRVLQGLAQQGGISTAVDTAISSYGSGDTKKASDQALAGLNAEFTKLATASQQVAEAFGTPLLGAVTKIVQIAGAPVRAAAVVTGSGPVQALLKYVVPAVVAAASVYMAGRAAGAFGLTAAFARQGLNNGPVRAFREASQVARGRAEYGPMMVANASGALDDRGTYGRLVRGAINLGGGYGEARMRYQAEQSNRLYDRTLARGGTAAEAAAAATEARPSIRQQLTEIAKNSPRAAARAARAAQYGYNAMMSSAADDLREDDPSLRRGGRMRVARDDQGQAITNYGKMTDRIRDLNQAPVGAATKLRMMATEIASFGSSSVKGSTTVRSASVILRESLLQTGRGLRELGTIAARSGVGSTIMAGAKAVVNPYMIGTTLAFGSYNYLKNQQGQNRDSAAGYLNASTTGTLDAYRDSMGRATDATQTFAEQAVKAGQALMRSVSTNAEAGNVNADDVNYASRTKKNVVRRFTGSAAQVAAQINAATPDGLSAQDEQGIKIDLLRQFSQQKVSDVLGRLGTAGNPAKTNYNDVFGAVGNDYSGTSVNKRFFRNILGQQGNVGGGWRDKLGMVTGAPGQTITGVAGLFGIHGTEVGSSLNHEAISKQQGLAIASVQEGIGQTYSKNLDRYGSKYAEEQRGRSMNEAFGAVLKTNNKDLIAATSRAFSVTLSGNEKDTTNITSGEAKKHGGFLQAFLAEQGKGDYSALRGLQLDASKGGTDKVLQQGAIGKLTKDIPLFGDALKNATEGNASALNKLTKAFEDAPGDTAKMNTAVNAFIDEGLKAGSSLADIGTAARDTVDKLGDATSIASQLAAAVAARADTLMNQQAPFLSPGMNIRNKLESAAGKQAATGSDETAQASRDEGQAQAMDALGQAQEMMRARLAAIRNYGIQLGRANFDFRRQETYAEADYQKQVRRADEDYHEQRYRSNRDFNISVQQSTEDFHLSQFRSQRDFNKSMRRMNEDAAKAMYDPYKRIQVQAVSDAGTLMVNLREQNAAMAAQKANLDKIRKAGVNNATIDQLSLNKVENAQELQRLLGDITTNPGIAKGLNDIAAKRIALGGVLNQDASNKEVSRAKEDFATQLKDQSIDFDKSITRSRAAFARSMADMAKDYAKSLLRSGIDYKEAMRRNREAFQLGLTRMKEDLDESQRAISGTFEQLQEQVMGAMQGKAVQWGKIIVDGMSDTLAGINAELAKHPDLFKGAGAGAPAGANGTPQKGSRGGGAYNAGAVAQGNTTSVINQLVGASGSDATVTSVNTGTHANDSLHYKMQAVDYGGTEPELHKLAAWMQKQAMAGKIDLSELIYWDPKTNEKFFIKNNKHLDVYDAKTWAGHKNHVHVGMDPAMAQATITEMIAENRKNDPSEKLARMAEGGIATGPLKTWVAEAGHPEAVIPLNTSGVAVLAKAMTQFITEQELRRMTTGNARTSITYTGNQFIEDHSTDISGKITVVSNDPDDMMRQMQAKARRSNLTAPPQRKGAR